MTPHARSQPRPRRGCRRARRIGFVAALGCTLACVDAAQAAPDGAKAEALFREGKALLDAGQTDAACAKLDASWQLEPAPGTLLNLAMCHSRQGRTATAWAEFLRAADMSQAAGNKARAEGARELAAGLEPRLCRLLFRIAEPTTPGLVVEIDGKALPASALDTSLPLDPGRHEVVARAPGRTAWRAAVEIAEGRRDIELAIPLLEATTAAGSGDDGSHDSPAGPSWIAPVGWIAVGLGTAGLVVGGALGAEALRLVSDAEQDPALCPEKRCQPAGRDQLDSAEALGNGSTAALVAGGSLLLVGVATLLASLDSPQPADTEAAAHALCPLVVTDVASSALLVGAFGHW